MFYLNTMIRKHKNSFVSLKIIKQTTKNENKNLFNDNWCF